MLRGSRRPIHDGGESLLASKVLCPGVGEDSVAPGDGGAVGEAMEFGGPSAEDPHYVLSIRKLEH